MVHCFAYGVAKARLNFMMRSIAVELATHGMNVNGIETAWIDTPGEHVIFREETIAEKIPNCRGNALGCLKTSESSRLPMFF